MKFLFIIFCCFMAYEAIFPVKMRFVQFEKEMANAQFIGRVIIEKYDTNGVFEFRSLEFKDTIASAKSYLLFNRFHYQSVDTNDYWVYRHPRINDTVLIVVDSVNTISLFAKLIGNDYRFWDPHGSTSLSLFSFNPPVKRLNDARFYDHIDSKESYTTCLDGCLLNKDSINYYKKNTHK